MEKEIIFNITTCKCPECGVEVSINEIEKRRMNTAYINQEDNFSESCIKCFDETQLHWDELWKDYGNGNG